MNNHEQMKEIDGSEHSLAQASGHPTLAEDTLGSPPFWFHFRRHFLMAPIFGLLFTGHPFDVLFAFIQWPTVLLMIEFVAWAFPVNLLGTVVTIITITILQIQKRLHPSHSIEISLLQIVTWWGYWIWLGTALRFGTYGGP